MDNSLDHAIGEITARRDDRLRDVPTIPPHRLGALRDAFARSQAANTTHGSRALWLASLRASFPTRLCIAAAAACLLVLALFLRTTIPSATSDRVTTFAAHARTSAFERSDAPTLTLRMRSADLLQMQPGLLACTALGNQASDELIAVRLDVSLDTGAHQLH